MTMTETTVFEIENLILSEIQNSPKKSPKKVSFSKSLENIRCFRRADPVLKVKYPNAPLNEYGCISQTFISSHSHLGLKPSNNLDLLSSSSSTTTSSLLGSSPPITPTLLKNDNFSQINHKLSCNTTSSFSSSYLSTYSPASPSITSSPTFSSSYLPSTNSKSSTISFTSPTFNYGYGYGYQQQQQYSIRSQSCSMLPLSELIEKTKRNGVSIDGLHLRGLYLEGHVAVHNISFEKKVTIRFTFDEWVHTEEVEGQYESSDPSGQLDRFSFRISLENRFQKFQQQQQQQQTNLSSTNLQKFVCMTMFLAIRYLATNQGEFWDNNNNMNHRIDFLYNSPSTTTTTTSTNSTTTTTLDRKKPEERVSSLSLSLSLEQQKLQERNQLTSSSTSSLYRSNYGFFKPKTVEELLSIPIGPDTPPTQHLSPPKHSGSFSLSSATSLPSSPLQKESSSYLSSSSGLSMEVNFSTFDRFDSCDSLDSPL